MGNRVVLSREERRLAKQKLESERLDKLIVNERPFWEKGIAVAGMDEVGRGPLAGPVVTACVILPPNCLIEGVNDSKKLSEKKRSELSVIIKEKAIAYGFGRVEPEVIDEINILEATKLAFCKAYSAMGVGCKDVFVDAVKDLDIEANQHPLIHGDAVCYSIAAASIIAKVERDNYMIEIANEFPQYGFERNKGYGTKEHCEALSRFGPCRLHRRSFIKKFIGQ